ncbi:3-oxoacyl-ACP reductase FabG [Spongorhabdus nitratireducens]
MFSSLENYSVIVTGGTKGIGKGIAKAFARQKARIMIAARDRNAAKTTLEELSQFEGDVHFCCCDVSDWDDVQHLVEHTVNEFGGLDILCANAGCYPVIPIEAMTPGNWDEVLDNNLKSSFLCVKAALPHLSKAGHGRVILTSSITGPMTGIPGLSHYGASKAGQLGFMRTAAMELAKYQTTVNAILPGFIYTEGLSSHLSPDDLDAMAATIPLKRIGHIDDIGHTALFLASKEAGYITGQTIVVDGGQTLPETLALHADF